MIGQSVALPSRRNACFGARWSEWLGACRRGTPPRLKRTGKAMRRTRAAVARVEEEAGRAAQEVEWICEGSKTCVQMLCLSFCDGRPQRDVIADRPHCNLKKVFITGFIGNGGQVALVKYILRNAVQLELMAIDPKGNIMDQILGEYEGRRSAKSKLVPADKNGVLVIL
ncbi:hypothetical protein PR202_ga04215 [Eleusine coracana subsp. coracana]|uniref:FBD domain-containing protein n=1 Tax=Eleusine coracana subsp. coracana TaxID=191504 RepID=A0AAV5BPC2_ELECO|nr:hypothetical protein PR202_ga04215 [Eleusine coracana subsp. coracana]